MKIILDQRGCKCWDAPCEAHFGWHFLRDEVTPVDCTMAVVYDDNPERVFLITDRDGVEKELVIDSTNWDEATDSWKKAWEEQQKKKK